MTTSRAVLSLLPRFHSLRAAVFAFNVSQGAEFACEAGREWNARGAAGLASACFNLGLALSKMPGAWDLREVARDLARDFAAQA